MSHIDHYNSKHLDIASEGMPLQLGTLDRVGMSGMEFLVELDFDEKKITCPAKVDIFVNINNPETKGIHMSRLYLICQRNFAKNSLELNTLKQILSECLQSHSAISNNAYINVHFEYPLVQQALLSQNLGVRTYPTTYSAKLTDNHFSSSVKTNIQYSSTCPCSASLARELIQKKFSEDFANTDSCSVDDVIKWLDNEKSINATPHGQRSVAKLTMSIDPACDFDLKTIIKQCESALKTPVQSAVKREDEQEFARLNASQLMFSEDAARILKHELNQNKNIIDFEIEVTHFESLHPHNAVAFAKKIGNLL